MTVIIFYWAVANWLTSLELLSKYEMCIKMKKYGPSLAQLEILKIEKKFLTRQIEILLVRLFHCNFSDVSTKKTTDDTNCPTIHNNL